MGMSIDKAIRIIKEIEYPANGDNMQERKEAMDMAIKALEQLPKLQNRCFALTHGQVCVICPYDCKYNSVEESDIEIKHDNCGDR